MKYDDVYDGNKNVKKLYRWEMGYFCFGKGGNRAKPRDRGSIGKSASFFT